MRKREYISPSQIMKWYSQPEQYFLEYLASVKVPRIPQTMPMAVGTGFDIEVKCSLHRRFKGGYADYDIVEDVWARQIENPEFRAECRKIGLTMLSAYQASGAYHDLTMEVGRDLTLEADGIGELWGIPIVYKPDIFFRAAGSDAPMVIDWKVNGYCSNSNVSPKPGFVKVSDGWKEPPFSRGNRTPHKDAKLANFGDVVVNTNKKYYQPGGSCWDWHVQLLIYAMGVYGVDAFPMVVGIDQLACKTVGSGERLPRCARHRWVVTKEDANTLRVLLEEMWEVIHSDWVFRHMSRDESLRRQEELEKQAASGVHLLLR